MKKKSKTIFYSILLILGTSITTLITTVYLVFMPLSFSKDPYILNIPNHASINTIARILEDNQLIRHKTLFKLYIKLTNQASTLRAGSFLVNPSMNMLTICHVLNTNSGSYELIKVTIPEGFSIQQISALLEEKNICMASEFKEYASKKAKKEFAHVYPFLNEKTTYTTIEGYLYPETYHFKQNEPIKNIIHTMLKEFNETIGTPFKESIEKQSLSFNQVITLASMIEKETRQRSEMKIISSVYHNRLKKRMRLECDPTVVYALGKSHKDRVLYKDLEINSPYNTYRKKGLPPTPIASPGKKAIQAALTPEKTPYLFFVANSDGHHHFTKTYKEHLAYQRQLRK